MRTVSDAVEKYLRLPQFTVSIRRDQTRNQYALSVA